MPSVFVQFQTQQKNILIFCNILPSEFTILNSSFFGEGETNENSVRQKQGVEIRSNEKSTRNIQD